MRARYTTQHTAAWTRPFLCAPVVCSPWIASVKDKGILTGISIGAAILGVGMAVAGACPGMVLAQVCAIAR